MNASEAIDKYGYNLTVVSVTSTKVILQILFNNPLAISSSGTSPDQFVLTFDHEKSDILSC